MAGVGFVVTMVLLQLGFLEAVRVTATSLYDQLNFDVALISPRYDQLYDAGTFPAERLRQAKSLETVVDAQPMYVTLVPWRCPPSPLEPERAGEGAPAGSETSVPRSAGDPRSEAVNVSSLALILACDSPMVLNSRPNSLPRSGIPWRVTGVGRTRNVERCRVFSSFLAHPAAVEAAARRFPW
jgi:hypothetical protein